MQNTVKKFFTGKFWFTDLNLKLNNKTNLLLPILYRFNWGDRVWTKKKMCYSKSTTNKRRRKNTNKQPTIRRICTIQSQMWQK